MRLFFLLISFVASTLFAQTPFQHYQKAQKFYNDNVRDSSIVYARKAVEGYKVVGLPDSTLLSILLVSKNESILNTLTVSMETLLEGLNTYGPQLEDDDPALLQAIYQRGYLNANQYKMDSAIHYYNVALARMPEKATPLKVQLLADIGFTYIRKRDYNSAREYSIRAIKASRQLPQNGSREDEDAIMDAAHTMAVYYTHNSKYDSALVFAQEMLFRTRRLYPPDHSNIGAAHNELGTIFQSLCQYDSAVYHRKKCESIFYQNYLKEGQGRYLSVAYGNLGYLYSVMGEFNLALEYNLKALELDEKQYAKDSPAFTYSLTSIADDYQAMGKPASGLPYINRAYEIQKKAGPTEWGNLAYIENFLSSVHFLLGNYDSAKHFAELGLENYRKAKMGDNKISVNATYNLGNALVSLGDTINGYRYISDAIRRFTQFHVPWHENVINPYVYQSRAGRIFGLDSAQAILSEGFARASLRKVCQTEECILDSLFIAGHVLNLFQNQVELSALKDARSPQNKAHETDLWISRYESMASKYLGQTRSESGIRLVANVNKEVFDTGIRMHFHAWKRAQSPEAIDKIHEYLTKEKALSLRLRANNRNIQQYANLPADILNQEKSLLQEVTRTQLAMLQDSSLDSRKKYSDAIEQYSLFKSRMKQSYPQYYALKYDLSVPSLVDVQRYLESGERYLEFGFVDTMLIVLSIGAKDVSCMALPAVDVRKTIEEYNASVISRDIALHQENSGFIMDALLKPLLHDQQISHLIIGPDEVLYQMSFESVWIKEEQKYLLEKYIVSYSPSTDAFLRGKDQRGTGKPMLLDFTPGFEQPVKDAYLSSLDSLEADSIYLMLLSQPSMLRLSEVLDETYKSLSFRGAKATEKVFKTSAGDYKLIHMGTHAHLDDANPLYSQLILAKAPGSMEDGYLHTYEIYGIPLKADLTVLTACETGGGAFEAGQGIQSLAHAFAYAGCPSMVMSLWSLDEKSTAEITRLFYANLKKGVDRSEALSLAKREFLRTADPELRHPFYWSGLVLMGADGPVRLATRKMWLYYAAGSLALLLLTGLAIREKRKKANTSSAA